MINNSDQMVVMFLTCVVYSWLPKKEVLLPLSAEMLPRSECFNDVSSKESWYLDP